VDIHENNRDYLAELVDRKMIELTGGVLKLRRKGMLLADKIASELFIGGSET
jgi:hypothetical protein